VPTTRPCAARWPRPISICRALKGDVTGSREEINALLGRNMDQADGIGLRGTPAYIVGPFLVTAALNEEGFRQVVADARDRMNG
jgi:protein-disulfide isomerase